jgi:uncharacterized protein YecT (DUF1311 family)
MHKLTRFRLSVMILPFLTLPIAGIAKNSNDCLDKASTTVDMRACLVKELKNLNVQLNLTYKELRKELPSEGQNELKKAQKAWVQFRETECDFSAFSEQPGSIVPLIINSCYIDMTKERIKQLNDYITQNKN